MGKQLDSFVRICLAVQDLKRELEKRRQQWPAWKFPRAVELFTVGSAATEEKFHLAS